MNLFPEIFQPDLRDCGPTCLEIILKYYGKRIPLFEIREKCHCAKEGASLLGLCDAADGLGMHTQGVMLTLSQLREEAPFPCIVHWNQNHYIVVYKVAKRNKQWYVYVSDPASGLIKYTEEQFLKSWLEIKGVDGELDKGIALLIEPTPAFYEQEKSKWNEKDRKFTLKHLAGYLIPHKQSLLQLFLAMIVASILSLFIPFITQSVVDQGVTLGKLGFVKTMLIAQLLIVIGQLANDLIRNWLMLHTTARVSISLISDFLAKLMRLPISFFDT